MSVRIMRGDCRDVLKELEPESVHCVVTSPPYWGLRSYGIGAANGEIGLEGSFQRYVETMRNVFAEVRRGLRKDGTLWLNLGDSYAGGGHGGGGSYEEERNWRAGCGRANGKVDERSQRNRDGLGRVTGLKAKDLCGIPWRVAFALQADGWYLRSDIIWSKPNPMPESVTDRPTKAHEYVFLLSRSERYYYDAEAIAEPATFAGKVVTLGEKSLSKGQANGASVPKSGNALVDAVTVADTRNRRTVWEIATSPFPEAHFATFPPALIEPCILAGCPKGGTVLDPFGGAGTTGLVADRLGRNAILIELNPDYAAMAERRIRNDAGMFAEVSA